MQTEQDFPIIDMKERYLEADFQFRIGRSTAREFGEIELSILLELISLYETYEPFYTQFKLAAINKWNNAPAWAKAITIKRPELKEIGQEKKPKITPILRSEYLLNDISYRKGNISRFIYNRFLCDWLVALLNTTGKIQPYLTEMENAAARQWCDSPEYRKIILSKL